MNELDPAFLHTWAVIGKNLTEQEVLERLNTYIDSIDVAEYLWRSVEP